MQSKDIEDLITVIDGRSELVGEIRSAADDVHGYLAKQAKELLSSPAFIDALPGHVLPDAASQERVATIIARLKKIGSLET